MYSDESYYSYDDYDYDDDFNLKQQLEQSLSYDESQALHSTLHDQNNETILVPAQDNPNIVYSNDLHKSGEFLSQVFNISPRNFKRNHIPGLIILRLEDISAIRNDQRCHRIIPHILVNGDLNGLTNNPDFAAALRQLYQ